MASELLRRGYDVFTPYVDVGIDLIAKVDRKYVSIQVRESKFYPKREVYWQEIKKGPFDEIKGENAFYVFVLRRGAEINYLVVPSLWIGEHSDRFYFDVKNRKWFFYFKIENGKAFETRKSQLDFTPFLNNWDQLRLN